MLNTVIEYLENAAAQWPDKTALTDAAGSTTFSELHHAAHGAARLLAEFGVQPGDRIGVCMSKSIDQAVAVLAIMLANAVFVPILPRLKPVNIQHIVDDCGMALMVVDATRMGEVDKLENAPDILFGSGEATTSYPSITTQRQFVHGEAMFNRVSYDLAAIIYSSGSTGRPKGIMIPHEGLHKGARIVARYLGTRHEDNLSGVLSLNFDYGLNQLWQTLMTGCTLHFHDFVFPNDFFSHLDERAITAVPVMPVIISKIFDQRFAANLESTKFPSVRYVCTSGGAVSEKMISDLKGAFPNADVVLMYGLTEAFRSTFLPASQIDIRPTSIGKAIPDVELLVLDDDGNDCPPGVPGELVHRGGCIAKGYWNSPEKTAERFRHLERFPGETVVFSGDMVRRDEDGFIYFIGRKDSMIKSHGYRISPTEVEEQVNAHEDVVDSVATGIENVEVGYDVAIAYTTRSGQPLPERPFRQFLKQQLPSHMVPRHVIHLASMPSTGNEGKIDRPSVVEMIARAVAGEESKSA